MLARQPPGTPRPPLLAIGRPPLLASGTPAAPPSSCRIAARVPRRQAQKFAGRRPRWVGGWVGGGGGAEAPESRPSRLLNRLRALIRTRGPQGGKPPAAGSAGTGEGLGAGRWEVPRMLRPPPGIRVGSLRCATRSRRAPCESRELESILWGVTLALTEYIRNPYHFICRRAVLRALWTPAPVRIGGRLGIGLFGPGPQWSMGGAGTRGRSSRPVPPKASIPRTRRRSRRLTELSARRGRARRARLRSPAPPAPHDSLRDPGTTGHRDGKGAVTLTG